MFFEEQLPNVPAPARVLIVSSLFCVLAPCAVVYMAATAVAEGVVSCGGSIGSYCSSGQLAADLSSCVALQDKATGQRMAEEREDDLARLKANLCNLPYELRCIILEEMFVQALPSSTWFKHDSFFDLVAMSRAHCDVLRRRLYGSIHISNSSAFDHLRRTLLEENPSLGQLVSNIAFEVVDTKNVDSMTRDLQQMLLTMPNVQSLSLNGAVVVFLAETKVRLLDEDGPRPRRLRMHIASPDFLSWPLFQHVEEYETLCGSSGTDTYLELSKLRRLFPHLKRLTIRLSRSCWSRWDGRPHTGEDADAQEDSTHDFATEGTELILGRYDSLWSDTTVGRREAERFETVLRFFRIESESCGARLESLTVLAWPAAIRYLRKKMQASHDQDQASTANQADAAFVTTTEELQAAVKRRQTGRRNDKGPAVTVPWPSTVALPPLRPGQRSFVLDHREWERFEAVVADLDRRSLRLCPVRLSLNRESEKTVQEDVRAWLEG